MIEKILLTRPAGFNDELAGALAAQGIAVLQAPLVRIQGLDPAGLRPEPKILLDPEQVIIFTSQNAIDYAGDLIPQLAQAAKAHVFAVGPATQMRLKEMGIVATAPDQPGSEPLLSLPAFTAPFDKKVLIVTGRLGRDYLETTLRARGAAVARYECYERVPLLIQNLDDMIAQGYHHILVTSTDILQALASHLTALSRPQVVLCVTAKRIKEAAHSLGLTAVIEAPDASVSGILKALTSQSSNQSSNQGAESQ